MRFFVVVIRLVEIACKKFPDYFADEENVLALAQAVTVYIVSTTEDLTNT
jgi:hypothetical protein